MASTAGCQRWAPRGGWRQCCCCPRRQLTPAGTEPTVITAAPTGRTALRPKRCRPVNPRPADRAATGQRPRRAPAPTLCHRQLHPAGATVAVLRLRASRTACQRDRRDHQDGQFVLGPKVEPVGATLGGPDVQILDGVLDPLPVNRCWQQLSLRPAVAHSSVLFCGGRRAFPVGRARGEPAFGVAVRDRREQQEPWLHRKRGRRSRLSYAAAPSAGRPAARAPPRSTLFQRRHHDPGRAGPMSE